MSEAKKPSVKPPEGLKQKSEDQILKEILGNLPANDEVELKLPSKNKFYNLVDPAKPITLRPMTFEDEKAMMSNKNPNVDVINSLLARCVTNINIATLLQLDKLYIIMQLRSISYGDEYAAQIACPSCKRDNKVKFNLCDLQTKYIPEDLSNPIELTLPVLQKTMKVRLPRIEDERYFTNSEMAMSNMWRFVEEIDGHDAKVIISKVVEQLPLKDAHALLNVIGGNDYGIDTRVRFVCNSCSHHEVMELPITTDFFTAS